MSNTTAIVSHAYVGPDRRTERAAMRHAERTVRDYRRRVGLPRRKITAKSARRITSVPGWSVEIWEEIAK